MKWISTNERLPTHRQLVLIYEPNTNCFHGGRIRSRYHVVQFVQGKIPKAGQAIQQEDQFGNNLKPYLWVGDGPCNWFGQEVTFWAQIVPPRGGSQTHPNA